MNIVNANIMSFVFGYVNNREFFDDVISQIKKSNTDKNGNISDEILNEIKILEDIFEDKFQRKESKSLREIWEEKK